MSNLLYKEFKLCVHLTSFLFLPLAAMLLIPNYPYYVSFFYQTLAIFFLFLNGNTNNDVTFTTLLPIRKRDAVKARVMTVVILEAMQVLVSIPFTVLRNTLITAGNAAGMEANAALFGLALIMFGLFNLVFLPGFYKTAYRTGTPYLLACAAMTLFVVAAEVAVNLVPGWKAALDSVQPASLLPQLAVLAAGGVLFALLTWLSYNQSVKKFEQLDL